MNLNLINISPMSQGDLKQICLKYNYSLQMKLRLSFLLWLDVDSAFFLLKFPESHDMGENTE